MNTSTTLNRIRRHIEDAYYRRDRPDVKQSELNTLKLDLLDLYRQEKEEMTRLKKEQHG